MKNFFATLYFAFNAVIPIFLLILLGYYAKRKNVVTQDFLKIANRFNYRFAISALLFINIYSLDRLDDIPFSMILFIIMALIVLTLLGFLMAHFATKCRARKGVLIQTAFRSNYAIIGLAIAGSLAGTEGSVLASAMQAPSVIYFNLVAVLCMSIYADDNHGVDLRRIVKGIITNPLIIGLTLGLTVHMVRRFIPLDESGNPIFTIVDDLPWLYSVVESLGHMGIPLALIVLGGQFCFTDVKGIENELAAGILLRLVVAPCVGFLMAFLADYMGLIILDHTVTAVLIALFGSPAAINSVVMASEMNADDILAGQIVVWTSFLSIGSVFVQIVLFRVAGML